MAVLSAKARKQLPVSQFAGPGRTYPIPDVQHAALAKARATQQQNKGNLSKAQADRIRAAANKKLRRARGNSGS